MSKDARAFFFHFNKPASKAAGTPKISVHTKGKCYIVDNVECEVPTKGRHQKRQPHFIMTGRGCVMLFKDRKTGGELAVIKERAKGFEALWLV